MRNITTTRNILGECPVWSPEERKLYWMDLLEPALYAYEPATGRTGSWAMPKYLGGLAVRRKGGLVIGMQHRIVGFQPENGAMEDIAVFGEIGEAMRFNDGKCDRRGRFFIGNMKDPATIPDGSRITEEDRAGAGSIYVLETDGTIRVAEMGYTIPNGIAWNSDDSLLYIADSHHNSIYVYDYDLASGRFANKRVFASTRGEPGVPDGACLDAEGFLWSARNGGGRIVRYAPDGSVDRTVTLPVEFPTSVAFGGAGLDTLYVTTATQGMTADDLRKQPLAGTVLAVDVGVRGISEPAYGG